jgi:hypothetical protein
LHRKKRNFVLAVCSETSDHGHFPLNPWVFPGTKACGDLNLLPNCSSRLLVQSHKYLSNQKKSAIERCECENAN